MQAKSNPLFCICFALIAFLVFENGNVSAWVLVCFHILLFILKEKNSTSLLALFLNLLILYCLGEKENNDFLWTMYIIALFWVLSEKLHIGVSIHTETAHPVPWMYFCVLIWKWNYLYKHFPLYSWSMFRKNPSISKNLISWWMVIQFFCKAF